MVELTNDRTIVRVYSTLFIRVGMISDWMETNCGFDRIVIKVDHVECNG
jgi:hypothetical protein